MFITPSFLMPLGNPRPAPPHFLISRQTSICFPALGIGLHLLGFYINGIKQYVLLADWLLALSIAF